MKNRHSNCPYESTLRVIGGRWKILILRELFPGVKRFGELARGIQGISQRMLTQELRDMEKDGIVRRKVFAQIPPRVDYSLTPLGRSLKPILEAMEAWGTRHLAGQKSRPRAGQKSETVA